MKRVFYPSIGKYTLHFEKSLGNGEFQNEGFWKAPFSYFQVYWLIKLFFDNKTEYLFNFVQLLKFSLFENAPAF